MNILAFADTRTSVKLPDVDPDVVLLLGDIPSKMVSEINRKYNCLKLGVMGNHCHHQNLDGTDVVNMHNEILDFKGITFAGFEGSPVYKEPKFGQHTETEARDFVRKIGNQRIDILLTHSNPIYPDIELDNAHRGFEAFNELISSNQVTHFFHGHLHDPFTRQIEDCTIYSVFAYLWVPNLHLQK